MREDADKKAEEAKKKDEVLNPAGEVEARATAWKGARRTSYSRRGSPAIT